MESTGKADARIARAKGTDIVVRRAPDLPGRARGTRGVLRLGPLALPCALGRSGIRAVKLEGDGATPIGRLPVLSLMIRADRWAMPPRSPLPARRVHPGDGWCDAPRDASYNRPVRLPHRAGAEAMVRGDRLYDAVVVLDYNVTRRARGRGSAVFWHVAKPGLPTTEGCIALAPSDMARILPHLRRGRGVVVKG